MLHRCSRIATHLSNTSRCLRCSLCCVLTRCLNVLCCALRHMASIMTIRSVQHLYARHDSAASSLSTAIAFYRRTCFDMFCLLVTPSSLQHAASALVIQCCRQEVTLPRHADLNPCILPSMVRALDRLVEDKGYPSSILEVSLAQFLSCTARCS